MKERILKGSGPGWRPSVRRVASTQAELGAMVEASHRVIAYYDNEEP